MSALRFTSILFLVFVSVILKSQTPVYRVYNTDHGLPSSEVYDIIQDSLGYLWFTTDHGLSRFDGYQFKLFDIIDGMPENAAFYFRKDSNGRIWFNTMVGMFGFIEHNKVYSYQHNDKLLSFIQNNHIRSIKYHSYFIESDGSILLNINNLGVYRIDTTGLITKTETQEQGARQRIQLTDNGGTFFVNSISSLISEVEISYDNQIFINIINPALAEKQSQSFYVARHNNDGLVYFSMQKSLFLFDKGKLKGSAELENVVVNFNFDRDGNVWVGTLSGGVYIYDQNLNLLKRLFTNESITCMFQDHEGGVWLGSLNNGVYYVPDVKQMNFTSADGLDAERITDIVVDKQGALWYASRPNMLGKITPQGIEKYPLNLNSETFIQKLLTDKFKDKLWIATNMDLYALENGNINKVKRVFINKDASVPEIFSVKTMEQNLKTGDIWLGHFQGVSNLRPDGITTHISYFDNSFQNRVESLALDDHGTLYIGSSLGLYSREDERYHYLGDKFPQLGNRITALLHCNDTLWIGTRGNGLFFIVNDSLKIFTTAQGLLSNSISAVHLTGNNILIGTNKGLSVTNRKLNIDHPVVYNFTKSTGLPGNEIISLASYGKTIYVATTKGIAVMQDNFNLPHFSLPLYFTSMQVNYKQADFTKHLTIPFNENNISIDYFAISFLKQGKHTYRHRLIGLENEWVVNQKTNATYPYLPPGNYTFELSVADLSGDWNPDPVRLSFTILKPYWQNWWFYVLIFVLIAGIIMFLINHRIQTIQSRNKLINEINRYRQEILIRQMNPHFLFNALNTLQRFILENDRLASSRYLSKFARLMRKFLDGSQKQTISLKEEISTLSLYLELESARFRNKFTYAFYTSAEIDPDKVGLPVYMIQPLVENAIWHGFMTSNKDGILEISFVADHQNGLVCKVKDNGIGREQAKNNKSINDKKSYGLSIIQKRISLINLQKKSHITLSISDLKDKTGLALGTEVTITFPDWIDKNV